MPPLESRPSRPVIRRGPTSADLHEIGGRLGLAIERNHTLEEVGGRPGLSRERAREIELTALTRLQEMVAPLGASGSAQKGKVLWPG